MALWNEKDSRWDNVPDADLTFSDYVTKLLRQPSTFARPAFGGPFASTAQPAPVADQTKMEGMFEEYLKGKQQPSSSAPFGYDSEGNRRTAPETNLSDSQWDTVMEMRRREGFLNDYEKANLKTAGMALMGMLGGPLSFAQSAYRAQEPANQAYSILNDRMLQYGLENPNSVISQVYGYQVPSSGGVAPVAPEPYITGGAIDYGSSSSGSYGDGAYGSEAGYSNQANSGWASSDSYSGWSPGSSTD
jgi:hypothetical protein